MKKDYYYIELDLKTMKAVDWGTTKKPTLDGSTLDPNLHRIFITKGQYNKLVKHL